MKNQLNFNIVSDEELSEANGGKLTFIQSTAAGDLYYNTNTHKYFTNKLKTLLGCC
ncbi:Bacteriocin lactococcin-A [Lactococcus lactis]|nr:Bacteriocin lactococcin-A [Lactococcus lactis]